MVQSSAPRRLKKTKVLDMSVVLTILVHYSESSRQTAKGCAYQSRQTMNKRKEKKMVNTRVELATLALLAPRSNQLS